MFVLITPFEDGCFHNCAELCMYLFVEITWHTKSINHILQVCQKYPKVQEHMC